MKTLVTRMIGSYLNTVAIVSPSRAAVLGFQLFCRPFRSKITLKQQQFFNSSDRSELTHGDDKIQIYRWGRGDKKVLFLHGWQSHTYRWKPYIEALNQDEFTIYSLDAPGHGLSTGKFLSVPVYSELIETFIRNSGPFHSVIGHSLGGFSLLYAIHKYPLLPVNQLILLAPPGEASDFISVFQKSLGLSSRALTLVLDHFKARYEVGPEYFSTTRFVKSLNMTGLIIHDEDDVEAPHHYSVPLHQGWDRSRLITTKGFGHNLRSPKVVKSVVEFITDNTLQLNVQPISLPLEKQ